jgi:chromosome partitioning protein
MEQNNNNAAENMQQSVVNTSGNKIIVFANQKGGVGKTTLCALFANFLAFVKGVQVFVVDGDPQIALTDHRKTDLKKLQEEFPGDNPENHVGYVISEASLDNGKETSELMMGLRGMDFTTIIDTPGSLSEDGMMPILANCDYIVVPLTYDEDTLKVTNNFMHLIYLLKKNYPQIKSKLIFLPNRNHVNRGNAAERKVWEESDKYFSDFGIVLSDQKIKDIKSVQNYDTIGISKAQLDYVQPAFEKMFNIIYGGQTDGNEDKK